MRECAIPLACARSSTLDSYNVFSVVDVFFDNTLVQLVDDNCEQYERTYSKQDIAVKCHQPQLFWLYIDRVTHGYDF